VLSFESRRSTAYDTKLEMMCAEPGMTPMRNPSTVPRPIGAASDIGAVEGTARIPSAPTNLRVVRR